MNIIISIHSKHAKNIYEGKKIIEIRRVAPIKHFDIAYIYEPNRKMHITGYFKLSHITAGDPIELLNSICPNITRKDSIIPLVEIPFFQYLDYFHTCSTGHFLFIREVVQFDTPIHLPNHITAPQNFCYFSSHFDTATHQEIHELETTLFTRQN